jgi:nucleoside-diphosphate-sugar epimerase
MNLLITGGSGFIGTRLVGELLEAGHQVAIFDIAASATYPALCRRGDVRDRQALTAAAAGCDAIIHLAAEHRDDALSTALCEEVNVGGAENVVAAARAVACRRVVFTSSVAVYPLNTLAATEEDRPRPYNRYGESKLAAEQVFLGWARGTPGATLVTVRACVVFGEGNRGNVYNLLSQIQRKRFLMVGRGRNKKSMAYLGNVSRFLASCLDYPPGTHLLNYADKPDLSMAELVGIARRALSTGRKAGSAKGEAGARGGELLARIRLPYWIGLAGGFAFDALSKLTGQAYRVSSIRIRKFCAETTVSTRRLDQTGFVRPFALEEALVSTIRFEFGER